MHEVWRLLLDEEFLHAYKHGIVLMCADGIQRRVYPRIFTYSADYPEKCIHQQSSVHCVIDSKLTEYCWPPRATKANAPAHVARL